MIKLHDHGFKTKVIVCDGASSNLKMIKCFMQHRGTFDAESEINPKFRNPLTDEFIYFVMCPHIN
jgi:hypothetical protein